VSDARRPAPAIDADTAPYWEALREGTVLIQWCAACRAHQFYPRLVCRRCWGSVEWVAARGRGRVYSFTVVHRAPAGFQELAPYAVALVELEEGVRMMGHLAGDPDRVAVGMPVVVRVGEVEEGMWLPGFEAT
jgi:uncharacterized protein